MSRLLARYLKVIDRANPTYSTPPLSFETCRNCCVLCSSHYLSPKAKVSQLISQVEAFDPITHTKSKTQSPLYKLSDKLLPKGSKDSTGLLNAFKDAASATTKQRYHRGGRQMRRVFPYLEAYLGATQCFCPRYSHPFIQYIHQCPVAICSICDHFGLCRVVVFYHLHSQLSRPYSARLSDELFHNAGE